MSTSVPCLCTIATQTQHAPISQAHLLALVTRGTLATGFRAQTLMSAPRAFTIARCWPAAPTLLAPLHAAARLGLPVTALFVTMLTNARKGCQLARGLRHALTQLGPFHAHAIPGILATVYSAPTATIVNLVPTSDGRRGLPLYPAVPLAALAWK
jgi:hypothetical protein